MRVWAALLLALALTTNSAAREAALAPTALTLSPAERELLAAHPVLRLGVESNWEPVEFIDAKGVYSGVTSSYMRALEQRLGIRFEIVRKDSWTEVVAAFNRGEIDVLSALGVTPERQKTMRFTQPYIEFAEGIIVRSDERYVEQLSDVAAGKRLAVIDGYSSSTVAARDYPQLVLIPVRSTEEALFSVSTGRADLAVATLAVAYHLTQSKGLSNLRVAANFAEDSPQQAMAVQPALAALVPIFDKALQSISLAERVQMRERWTHVPIDSGVDRKTVRLWTVLGLIGLLVLLAWIAFLVLQRRRHSRLLARTEQAELQFRAMIEAMPALFWILHIEPGRTGSFTFFGREIGRFAGKALAGTAFDEVTRPMLPEDRQRFQQLLEEHGRQMTALHFEHALPQPGGDPVWIYVQAVPRRQGSALMWYGCSVDISERKVLEAALEQSRKQLEELAAGVPGALWQFRREADGHQHYSYMSDGIVGITGRTPAETNRLMLDKSFDNVHPDDVSVLQGLMQRLTQQPGIDEARYRLRTTQGEWKWVQVAARAMPVGNDGALVWNGITLDATRIQETEDALRFERQRFQDMADNLSGAMWRMRQLPSGQMRFEYVSEGVVNIAGRTAAEILSDQLNPLRFVVSEDQLRLAAALKASAETGEPIEIEYSSYAAHGGLERLFARAAVRHENGLPVWTGILLNVSERHRLQQSLEEVHSRLEDIARNFPGAIFQMVRSVEGTHRFTYVSEGITALTGRPPRTSDGREHFANYDNIFEEDRARVREASEQMIRSNGRSQFDYRVLKVDGTPHWVHCAMNARRQPDGTVLINGLLLDAEADKRVEADLRVARERAESASRAKTRFLANMSHEIRTPMNAVIGLAHIAMTSESNPLQAERIGKIHKAGKALLKLLNDILEYARLDAGKFTPVITAFDLQDVSEALRLFCLPAAEMKGLTFEIDCPNALNQHWFGDATRIQQVLLNLLTNAIKFTDGGAVRLLVRPLPAPEQGLLFQVCDTGMGMNSEQLERVFEAFEQASGETERRHGGSGLGLSISHELVQALGGRMRVESSPGKGTVFTVELPLKPALPARGSVLPAAEMAPRLHKLHGQLSQRDAAGARNSLSTLRMLLIPQGRDAELHSLERALASYDTETAQVELLRLIARWNLPSPPG